MKITETDFDNLSSASMRWSGIDWEKQADRFDVAIRYDWAIGYWFEDVHSMIMAKSFLNSRDIPFQETYDTGSDSWLIVTNYVVASCLLEGVRN